MVNDNENEAENEKSRIAYKKSMYIDEQNKLQTTFFRKSSDRQNFFNAKSEHPYSLKKSIPYSQTLRIPYSQALRIPYSQALRIPYSQALRIPYSQALRIRRIYSTFQDYHNHSRKLIEEFVNKRYKKQMLFYSNFEKLTNSIESNCSTNKNIMINNAYHYQ